MSIEQRRAKALKKKKLSKVQKAMKNKAAEFKRKDDLLRLIVRMITGSKSGASLQQIISDLQKKNSIIISASAIESLLAPDLKAGRLERITKGEGEEPSEIAYRLKKK